MSPLNLLSPNLTKALAKLVIYLSVATIVFVGMLFWHKSEVQESRLKLIQEIHQKYEERVIDLKMQSLTVENSLNLKIKESENAKTKQKAADDKRINSLIASLRDRPDRPSDSSVTGSTSESTTPTGATGLQLYSSDAKFLIGYARDTAELQSELKQCLFDYETVRTTLNQYRKDNQ